VIFTPLPTFAALYNKHTLPINHIAFSLCASLCFSVIHVACLCCSVCVGRTLEPPSEDVTQSEDVEEDDEPPARRTVPNRRRASSSGVSAADTSRRAPNHSRTSPAQDDGEPAEAKRAPEAGLAQSPPSPVPPTHYEVLGVGRDASNTDVKRAFFRLSRLYHPDKNVGREGDADDKFIQVRQAYETLSDLALRLDYDYELSCS